MADVMVGDVFRLKTAEGPKKMPERAWYRAPGASNGWEVVETAGDRAKLSTCASPWHEHERWVLVSDLMEGGAWERVEHVRHSVLSARRTERWP